MKSRTVKQLNDILWGVIKKWYVGDGLYLCLSRIILYDPTLSEIDGEPAIVDDYEVVGYYGRLDENGDPRLNFQYDFTLIYRDDDTDDFIAGMFYQTLCQNEGMYD